MVRKEMQKRLGERGAFTATFVRWGSKEGWTGPQKTMLVQYVRDQAGKLVADHLWFTCGKWTDQLGDIQAGDTLAFDARITEYEKGYKGRRWGVDKPISTDYRLSNPTKARRLP